MKVRLKMVLGTWLEKGFVAYLTFHMKDEDRASQHGVNNVNLSKIRTFPYVCNLLEPVRAVYQRAEFDFY